MGKVTTYCQISGCSPEVESTLEFDYLIESLSEEDGGDLSGPDGSSHQKVMKAIALLDTEDEREGTQTLSIIGPFGINNQPIWGFDEHPTKLDEILAQAEGHVRELSGCRMGSMFDMGFCEGPNGTDDGALISYGPYFFVLSIMLAILEGATQGRVTVQRLWRLTMMKGRYDPQDYHVLPGVDYGPICEHQEQFIWPFGDIDREELPKMGSLGTVEDIAEVIKKRGFWMWMRPDRFPIDQVTTPRPVTNISKEQLGATISHTPISKLPAEIVQAIAFALDIRDVITLAALNKLLYCHLLGNRETRDSFARAYMTKRARWCLPSGESELKWWNERRGDDALGWDYLRRCLSESHSMRNRRRIWRAAESIEEECERMEAEPGIE